MSTNFYSHTRNVCENSEYLFFLKTKCFKLSVEKTNYRRNRCKEIWMHFTYTNHAPLSRFGKSYSWKEKSVLIVFFLNYSKLKKKKTKPNLNLNLSADTVLLYLSSSKQFTIIIWRLKKTGYWNHQRISEYIM